MYYNNFTWWNVRFFAILFTPLFLLEIELFCFLLTLICEHIFLGIKNIIRDYVNNVFLQIVFNLMLYIVLLQYIRINIELWF